MQPRRPVRKKALQIRREFSAETLTCVDKLHTIKVCESRFTKPHNRQTSIFTDGIFVPSKADLDYGLNGAHESAIGARACKESASILPRKSRISANTILARYADISCIGADRMADATEYQRQAERCFRLAGNTSTPELVLKLKKLANEFLIKAIAAPVSCKCNHHASKDRSSLAA
jgi:hypothetical protein